jgi:hypothetical protein
MCHHRRRDDHGLRYPVVLNISAMQPSFAEGLGGGRADREDCAGARKL